MFDINAEGLDDLQKFYKRFRVKAEDIDESIPIIKNQLESKHKIKITKGADNITPFNKKSATVPKIVKQNSLPKIGEYISKPKANKILKKNVTKEISEELFKWFANKT